MRSHQTHSSSIILANFREQNENLLLEPLLSSHSNLVQSPDGLLVSEERAKIQSICLIFISKIKSYHCSMSICSARSCCLASLKWIPVLFILSIVGWCYYAYVVQMCILTIDNIPKKATYLIIYHLLIILFLWSYYRTIFKTLIGPPRQFYVNETDGEHIGTVQTVDERRAMLLRLARQSALPLLTRHFDGSIRYCFACQCIKPDRAHHCSICNRCVLRYDHHCPWTNSCISYGNYKYFLLFLGYALLFCIYVTGTSLEYFILFWEGISDAQKNENKSSPSGGKFHLLFLFFASIMFAISVSTLFFYHLFLTAKNRTTLESFRAPIFATGPDKEGFHLGWKQNFQEIFGTNLFKAFLPICTTRGDGVHYQINNCLLTGFQQQSGSLSGVTRSNHGTNEQNNHFIRSPLNRSSDVLIPLDSTSNSNANDRNYLFNGKINNR